MTDQQIIDWVYRRLASDWSASQLRRLGRRVRESLAVRTALRDRIMMDQLLCQTMAAPAFNPMQLLEACHAPTAPAAAPSLGGWKSILSKSTLKWGMGMVIAAAATMYVVLGPGNSPVTTNPEAAPGLSPAAQTTAPHADLPPSSVHRPSIADTQPPGFEEPVAAPDAAPGAPARALPMDEDDSPSDHLPPGYAPRPPLPPVR